MSTQANSHRPEIIALILFLCFAIGCTGNSEKKYFPTSNLAKGALEASLNKWKSGSAHGTITDYKVPINVFDARWQAGKKLESFEILSEEKSEGAKTFIVKMKLNVDKEEKEIKYLVVGQNPLNVFSESDFNKASGIGGK